VKASGTRLSTVANEGGHVGVDLDDAMKAFGGDLAADTRVFAEKPRPSLETYFHAIGERVVAHTHSIAVLLAACATRDPSALGLPVVPYERPGRGLALAVRRVREANPNARAIMLQSHGLLVDAHSADEAVAISRDVHTRALAAFGVEEKSFDALLASYVASPVTEAEGGFTRKLPPRKHDGRYLFPDAVVYASVVQGSLAQAAALGRAVVVVDGAGGRVAFAKTKSALDSCVEVLAAHDWVEDVLAKAGIAHYLDEDEPAKILDLPSEKYRMKLE